MSRDHTKLTIFELAHALVPEVYGATKDFPAEERFGLQSQIRRAAVSAATNIVEGCTRSTTKDFKRFLVIALGSATEANYLVGLACDLGFVAAADRERICERYGALIRSTQAFISKLEADEPKADSR